MEDFFCDLMETVYIETTVVSLLVANPSRDVVITADQAFTRDWWRLRRSEFVCVASSEVIREASQGDEGEVRKRMEILRGMAILGLTVEGERLMRAFLSTGALPPRAQADATHLAIAAACKVDYLLTWNCRHLANAQILRRLKAEAARLGCSLPFVCTPPELMGDYGHEYRPAS